MKRQGWIDSTILRISRTHYGTTLLRFAVPLMTVAAFVWLGYQFWRLIWGSEPIWPSSPVGAVDLRMRYDEVNGWFSGNQVYGGPNAGYPPASFVLLWPLLGWLELSPARWLWAVAMVVSLGWLIVLLWRETGVDKPIERIFVALMPLAIYPTGATIGNGQLIVLLLPAMVAGLTSLQRQRGWRDDLITALLMLIALIKPSISVPFFWILLFVPGTWRPAGIVSAGYLALTFFAASFQDASLPTLLREWMAGVSGLAAWGGYANLHSLLASLGLDSWSLPASLFILIVLGGWVYYNRQKDIWLLLGVTALVTRFWVYHGWYDDLLILLPMVALFRITKQSSAPKEAVMAGGLFALTLLAMIAPGGLFLFPPPWNTVYMTGQSIVWMIGLIFLLYLSRKKYVVADHRKTLEE